MSRPCCIMMPGDREFRYTDLVKDVCQDFFRTAVSQSKGNKCLRESVMNGSFGGLAGITLGYIYYTNAVRALGVGVLFTAAGYSITAGLCYYKESSART